MIHGGLPQAVEWLGPNPQTWSEMWNLATTTGIQNAERRIEGHRPQWRLTKKSQLWPFMKVITAYFSGIKNMLFLWGDLLVLITGITRAITAGNIRRFEDPCIPAGWTTGGDAGFWPICSSCWFSWSWVSTIVSTMIYHDDFLFSYRWDYT